MQAQSKRPWCCRCPSLCTGNWNNEHQSNFGNLQGSTAFLGKQLQCLTTFMGKILFPYVPLAFSLLPLVTVPPLVLCWAPGRRVGFPPSLASQTLPSLLTAQLGCPPPPSSSLLWSLADFFSGEALTPRSLSCGEEVMGTPGRPSPQDRKSVV